MSATQVELRMDDPDVIVRFMLTTDRAIDDFLADCRARGWSETSINSYGRTLFRFADRLPVDTDVSKITTDDLRRYRATRQKKLSRNTMAGEEAHLSSFLKWLYQNRKIGKDPMGQLERTKRISAEDLDVVTVSADDVRLLLEKSEPGKERNAIAILAYLGPRRKAVANLRLSDYDRERGLMKFQEKGSKPITKPVPDELATILNASITAGDIFPAPDDYLVPPGWPLGNATRDDRVIWKIVKNLADQVGVKTHVHALRAAFACFYLERNPDDLLGLKELMGHRSLNTTLIYLRRMNKQARMERVRTLSWQQPSVDGLSNGAGLHTTMFNDLSVMGAGGFEPPSQDSDVTMRPISQHLATSDREALH
ncbi:MAG: tyrosine-type recombinase/integrase [Sulfuricaulis sp.]